MQKDFFSASTLFSVHRGRGDGECKGCGQRAMCPLLSLQVKAISPVERDGPEGHTTTSTDNEESGYVGQCGKV